MNQNIRQLEWRVYGEGQRSKCRRFECTPEGNMVRVTHFRADGNKTHLFIDMPTAIKAAQKMHADEISAWLTNKEIDT